MTGYNAFVTVDDAGHLNDYSLVTVDGIPGGAPVPERCEHGFVLFWHRIAAALEPLGLRPAPNSVDDHVRRGVAIHFHAVAKDS